MFGFIWATAKAIWML